MDTKTLERLISKSYKYRNVYLTTSGPKRDRKDLIARNREYCKDLVEQLRVRRLADELWVELGFDKYPTEIFDILCPDDETQELEVAE